MQGAAEARLTLVEYGDYGCAHCVQAATVVEQLQKKFGQDLRFVYRNFARVGGHPWAGRAAEAAAAAGAQGKFWEMHALLLANRRPIDEAMLMRLPLVYADVMPLEIERFQRDLLAGVHAKRVEEDLHSGVASGVKSTPTFFINGVRHDDYWDLETLSAALEASAAG